MNILFTSAGRRSYLMDWFKEALKKEGIPGEIHAANSTALAPSFLEADRTVVTPLIYDPEYVPFLLKYCEEQKITAILSLLDTDLPVLAKHRKDFAAIGTQLLVADTDIVEACNDKFASYRFLADNGIKTPKTFLHVEDALAAIEQGSLTYPVIIKPRWGTGSISVQVAVDAEELQMLYRLTKKKVQESFLRYESAQDIEHCAVIQEFVGGEEYGLDVINDLSGKYVNTIVKKKIAMRSGETDCATTVLDEALSAVGERLSAVVKHPGLLDVDAFVNNGEVWVLEMNARFGGGYPFSHVAGADVPRAIVRWLAGREDADAYCRVNTGVTAMKDMKMIRF